MERSYILYLNVIYFFGVLSFEYCMLHLHVITAYIRPRLDSVCVMDRELNMYPLGDSDCEQRYKEAECASIACRSDSTSATLASRIGTGNIRWDGKVLR